MREVNVTGWKGKDKIEIENQGEDYLLREHRKNKESSEVYTDEHIVKKEDVDFLHNLIKKNCKIGVKYGYRFIASKIIEAKNLPVEINAWNGGDNRALYFFKYQYHPLKILEALGKINYYGRGGVELIQQFGDCDITSD